MADYEPKDAILSEVAIGKARGAVHAFETFHLYKHDPVGLEQELRRLGLERIKNPLQLLKKIFDRQASDIPEELNHHLSDRINRRIEDMVRSPLFPFTARIKATSNLGFDEL